METTPNGWMVLDRERAVLAHNYSFGGAGTANAFVARLADGKLLVISPPCRMTEAAFLELEAFGEVGAVVANNGFHHLGRAEWKKRYPDARYFASPQSAARIAKKNAEAGTFEPLSALMPLLGDDVGVTEVPETKCGETWMWARIGGGYAWYVSDVLANMPELPSNFVLKLLFKWTKSAPGYRPFNLALKFVVKDRKKVLAQLLEEMKVRPPTVVVPAHGPVLTEAGLAERTYGMLQAAL